MRYLPPPLIKRPILFSSTTLHMIDILKTQETTMLSCTASYSSSDSVCIPGQAWWFGLCTPQLQSQKVAPGEMTLSSSGIGATAEPRTGNDINDTKKILLCSASLHANGTTDNSGGITLTDERASGSFSRSHWPISTCKELDLLEWGASTTLYLSEQFPVCVILLKMKLKRAASGLIDWKLNIQGSTISLGANCDLQPCNPS